MAWSSDCCSSDLEGERLGRLHRRIEPAFLGQVADAVARLARAAAAEQFALAVVGLDDPEQHPERRRLARAVGAQHAVDHPLRHRDVDPIDHRSEEHTSELQSLMRISYAVFCLKKKQNKQQRKSSIKHAQTKNT